MASTQQQTFKKWIEKVNVAATNSKQHIYLLPRIQIIQDICVTKFKYI